MKNFLERMNLEEPGEASAAAGGGDAPVVAPPAAGDPPAPAAAAATATTAKTPEEEAAAAAAAEAPAQITAEDITVPEGFEIAPELMTEFTALINNAELDPKARVNSLVEMHTKALAAGQEKMATAWIERQTAAAKLITEDPVIGGANLQASQAAFRGVLDEFGSPELEEHLNTSGLGNQKAFADFLLNIAKVTAEGKPVVGAPTSGETKTTAETLYPTQGKV
jgi:hypothetical protein